MDGARASRRSMPGWMRPALEFGPLLVFFVAHLWAGIFFATGALLVALLVALALSWWIERRVAVVNVLTLVLALVLGGLTLWLRDERFLQLKPTLVYGLFTAVLLGGLALGKPLLQPVLGASLALTDEGWRALTLRFAGLFAAFAVLNEILRRTVSLNAWVAFKTWGFLPLIFVFLLFQGGLIRRFGVESQAQSDSEREG